MSDDDGGASRQEALERDFATLDCVARMRLSFEERICEASASRNEAVLDELRQEKMFEFAQFFFTIAAMGLDGPEDASLLADLHNDRIEKLLKDKASLKRRGFREERLLKAIFTSDTRPRLEHIWHERPGALDQSNLARFLVTQMSSETLRKLVEACEAAGFVERIAHPFGAIVVASTGAIEQILAMCLSELRAAVQKL